MKPYAVNIIKEYTLQLLQTLPLAALYKIIVQYMGKVSGIRTISIFIENNGLLERVYSTVPLENRIRPRAEGFVRRAFTTGKPYIYTKHEFELLHPGVKPDFKSLAIIPLRFEKQSIGVITLQSNKGNVFSEDIVDTLILMGQFASLAIRKAVVLKELKKTVKARDLFIAAASHELRTPLTVIQLYAQMVHDAMKNNKKIESAWADKLLRHTYVLTSIIEDFLQADTQQLKNIKIKYKRIKFAPLVQQALENFKIIFPNRNIQFRNHLKTNGQMIYADPEKILQVLHNILENAVKYSSPQDEIELMTLKTGSDVCVRIQDHGGGIAQENIKRIFHKYYRAPDNSYQNTGMGIGLYVAKSIVDLHGGMIDVASKEGQGTTVTIFLPLVYAH